MSPASLSFYQKLSSSLRTISRKNKKEAKRERERKMDSSNLASLQEEGSEELLESSSAFSPSNVPPRPATQYTDFLFVFPDLLLLVFTNLFGQFEPFFICFAASFLSYYWFRGCDWKLPLFGCLSGNVLEFSVLGFLNRWSIVFWIDHRVCFYVIKGKIISWWSISNFSDFS